jgi:hypothetical protein
MDMTDNMIADNIAARVVQIRANELNLAIRAAALRGLRVRLKVGEQDLDDDSPSVTLGARPSTRSSMRHNLNSPRPQGV